MEHLFTGYSDNSKCIVALDTNYFPALRGRETVGVSEGGGGGGGGGGNTLAIVQLIASK
jgi:hypothetical protein